MKNINEDISFLKDFVERRQTYIRFSPLWTAITWIMFIIYYFFWKQITEFLWLWNDIFLFLTIWIFGLILVTTLSIFNSKKRGEQLLPKSVRYVIVNMIFVGVIYFFIIFPILLLLLGITKNSYYDNWFFLIKSIMVFVSLVFYWLLIIVSRFCIPSYIKYFWLLCFVFWIIWLVFLIYTTFILNSEIFAKFYNEIILIFFWIWHLVMAYFLKLTNDKK